MGKEKDGGGEKEEALFHCRHEKVVKEEGWKKGLGVGDWLSSLMKQKILGHCSPNSVLKNTGLSKMDSRLVNIWILSVFGVVEQSKAARVPDYSSVIPNES